MIRVARPTFEMRARDEVEISEIYRKHAPDVSRWIAHLGGPFADVEDLLQEVFLVVQRKLPGFRGEAKLTTWLYGITDHVVSNARRKERFRRWTRRARRAEVADALAPSPSEPNTSLEREQARREVYAALEQLPDKYRTPFILFEIEGMPCDKIAELVGVRTQTLWVQIHRARAMFTEALKASGVLNNGG
jgi:RNA polymerase sigma-70 factor (ECF subfamily)